MAKKSKDKYEDMEIGQKAARIGLDSEQDIIDAINSNERFRNLLRKCLEKLNFNSNGNLSSIKGATRTKKDITVRIGENSIGISIKSSKKTSFHQTDRRRLEKWKEFLNMPDNIYEIIKEASLRISNTPNAKFIEVGNQRDVKNFFQNHIETIVTEIFTRSEEDLLLFLINNKMDKLIYIYTMNDVLEFLNGNITNNITFSNKGIIKLGDFLSIQRKGGNGKHISIPKTDWNHPGNQLQFKFSPLKFAVHIEKNKSIDFCKIEYKF